MTTYYAIIAKIDAKGRAVATCPGSHCASERTPYDSSKNHLERCTEAAKRLAENNNLSGYYVAASLKNGSYAFTRIYEDSNRAELNALTLFRVKRAEKYFGPELDISDNYRPKNYATHLMVVTLENDAESMRDIERIICDAQEFKERAGDQYISHIAARIEHYINVCRSRGVIAITLDQIKRESDVKAIDYLEIAKYMAEQ